LFARHGYRREEALKLPYWEFWDFVRAVKKEAFQCYMTQMSVNSLPEMEPQDRDRLIQKGLGVERDEDEDELSWITGLANFLKGNG
jgi:hypothetical protein